MATALNLSSVEYILECDLELDESEQTTFILKPLTAKSQAILQDAVIVSGDNTTIENFGTHSISLLKKGLVGWRNFKNDSGDQLKFNTSNLDTNINLLSTEYRVELTTQIISMNSVSEAEVKN